MFSPERQSARMSTDYKWRLNPVWHKMLYSSTHMATMGAKGLNNHLLNVQTVCKCVPRWHFWHVLFTIITCSTVNCTCSYTTTKFFLLQKLSNIKLQLITNDNTQQRMTVKSHLPVACKHQHMNATIQITVIFLQCHVSLIWQKIAVGASVLDRDLQQSGHVMWNKKKLSHNIRIWPTLHSTCCVMLPQTSFIQS